MARLRAVVSSASASSARGGSVGGGACVREGVRVSEGGSVRVSERRRREDDVIYDGAARGLRAGV
jgi:hypothetical protein